MATDCEKRLLKQFLDGIDTNELCKIVRSVYHGGAITANSREGKAITFKIVLLMYKTNVWGPLYTAPHCRNLPLKSLMIGVNG